MHKQLKAHNHKVFLLFRGDGAGGIFVALELSAIKTQEESGLLSLVEPECFEAQYIPIAPARSTARSISKEDTLPRFTAN